MDVAWHGILTCDYERTRPHASPLERELYTRSLTTWPAVLLGNPSPYGALRRPGLVDVPEADHHRLTGQLHAMLAEPRRARDLAERAAEHRRAAAAALDQAERSATGAGPDRADVAAATAAILPAMSAHIVNWLLPEEQWETRMAKLLGSRAAARACIAALSIPASAGHLLAQLTRSTPPGADGRTSQTRLDSAGTADRRQHWLGAAILAAAGDAAALDAVRAMVIALGWATESEERRRDLRERYLALAAAWTARMNLSPGAVTIAAIIAGTGA